MTIAETAKNVTLPQDTLRYYERIAQMQQNLERLDRKIAHYESRTSSVSTERSRTTKNVQPSNILFATARRPGNKRLPSPVKLVIL